MIYSRCVFLFAKSCQVAIQKLGRGGGSALPGLLAERLSRNLLGQLASQLQGSVVVVGTNGKTTTSRLLASYLEGADKSLVHNRSGSNLTRGVLSSLIAAASWRGELTVDWGLFEVDEAVLPKVLAVFSPTYLVTLNLFRDQLDRYGEVDAVAAKWRQAVANLPESTTMVINADDPLMADLGRHTKAKVMYFGVDFSSGNQKMAAYADSRRCPVCGQGLQFKRISYSHLGDYTCPNGDFVRPAVDTEATAISLKGMAGSAFRLVAKDVNLTINLGLAGVYNIYNVTAAMTVALQMGLPAQILQSKTRYFEAVFGRLEKITINDTELTLILVKNPTGYNQVIQTLLTDSTASTLWLLLNDRFADGRDISWIWDVELDALAKQAQLTVISGTRAYDMALRTKYAGFATDRVKVLPNLSEGLRVLTKTNPKAVYCLCTYTAMLELRRILQKRQLVSSYHGS